MDLREKKQAALQDPAVYEPFNEPYRYKVCYGGRAGARSWSYSRKLLRRGKEKKLLILCTRELQKSIKDSVHRLLKDQIALMGMEDFYTATDTKIRGANGTEFIFLGVRHNPSEIKSTEGIDICWLEEAEQLTQTGWDLIDPTVRKPGSEIWISYNTRFKFDTIHKMFVIDEPPPNSLVIKTSYKDNPFLPDVLRTQLEFMKEKDYEKYLHIWEGEYKSLAEGAIFGTQITKAKQEQRLCPIPIQSNCEVDTFSDLGKKDQTAFWFMQRIGKEYRFIDYYENRLQDVAHYVRFLKDLGYDYGKHYMPHDADHDRLGMVRNIREQFEDAGIRPVEIVDRTRDKAAAIQQGRDVFSSCWFHAKQENSPINEREGFLSWLEDGMQTRAQRMERGWEALCNYRYEYKDKDDVYQLTPHHDWASNGADAFLQFAQGYKDTPTHWGAALDLEVDII